MSRTSLLLAALLVVPACDDGAKDAKAAKPSDKTASADKAKAPADKDNKDEAKPAEPEVDPWKKALDGRVLAESGQAKDGRLIAFDIVNCESGRKYCQVCEFGPSPKIMAVGTVDDPEFHEDLKDIDAIVKKYGDEKLKAFAVVTDIVDGKGTTPADVKAAKERANELRQKLAISIPVVVPAPDDDGKNREWDEYYNITKSRTVMFADGRNSVKYSAVGPEDFADLNAAIQSVIES